MLVGIQYKEDTRKHVVPHPYDYEVFGPLILGYLAFQVEDPTLQLQRPMAAAPWKLPSRSLGAPTASAKRGLKQYLN